MADIQLGNVLTKEAMILDHTPFNSKEEMFQLLSEKFFEAGVITNQQAYLTALREREAMGPTYMGKCRSIHARIGNFSWLAGKRRICRSVGFGAQL